MSHATYLPGVNLSASYDGAEPTCAEPTCPKGSCLGTYLYLRQFTYLSHFDLFMHGHVCKGSTFKLLRTVFLDGVVEDSPRGSRTADRRGGCAWWIPWRMTRSAGQDSAGHVMRILMPDSEHEHSHLQPGEKLKSKLAKGVRMAGFPIGCSAFRTLANIFAARFRLLRFHRFLRCSSADCQSK